jgi:secreted trypsin-like serine protease
LVAQSGEYPFLASVSYLSNSVLQHHCEGLILNLNFVVTTATCFIHQQPAPLDQYRIRTGVLNLNNPEATQAIREISNLIIYPGASTANNDLALVRVSTPIVFNVNTQQIQISTSINFAMPFFATSYRPNNIKHHSRALTLPNASCFNGFPGNTFPPVQASQLCGINANPAIRNWESCVSARISGSPLLQQDGNTFTALSIASWTVDNAECNSLATPTISTNLIFYRSWIISNAI